MIPRIVEDITRVAFRFGIVVDQVCRSLEVSPDEINAEGAWVYCVYGVEEIDAHRAVSRFNAEKVSHHKRQDYCNVNMHLRDIPRQPWHLCSMWTESLLASEAHH